MEKEIKLSVDTKWFNWILSGEKKYEGRLNRRIFATLKVGDKITWHDNSDGQNVIFSEITSLKYFKTFSEAFVALGSELIPIPESTPETVVEIYRKYYTDAEVAEFGVTAIGISIQKN